MNVLVTGADGFIGRHLVRALLARGHNAIGCGRNHGAFAALFPGLPFIEADFAVDHDPAGWAPRLRDVDAVINAVGIFREHGSQSFAAIHTRAPAALFAARVDAGVRRVIQISALGADEHARSRYHLSKKAADDRLAGLDLDWIIVQPALVYGMSGRSTEWFNALASLPVIPVPGAGDQRIQPLHVDDAVAAIVALLQLGAPRHRRLPLVGPEPLSLCAYLLELRAALGLASTRCLPVPLALVRVAATVGTALPRGLLTHASIDMLLRGNTAEADSITTLLEHVPRRPREFVEPQAASMARRAARLTWLLPLLRASIALVWITSGLVALGIYPTEQSYALLARVGIIGTWAPLVLYGAAGVDLALGVATLALRHRRRLWQTQIALVLGYSAMIAYALPEFWLHPFGPLVKNAPILVGLLMLFMLEDEWNT